MDTYYSVYCDGCKYSGGVWSPGNITNSCMQVKGEQRSAGKDNMLGQVGNLIKLYKNCHLLLLYCRVPLASSVIQNEKKTSRRSSTVSSLNRQANVCRDKG